MDEYIEINYLCANCGIQLEAELEGISTWGNRKFNYRHINHQTHCEIYREASPFSNFAAEKQYDEALRRQV